MLTIELEPELEINLNNIAEKEQRSVSDVIKQLINNYLKEKQESDLLVDIAKTLPTIACFENKDPLELQKAMRDETEGEKLLAVLKKTGFLGSLPDVPDLSVNYKAHLDWSDKI